MPPPEEWYAEPAQVFDNLYFVGTRDRGRSHLAASWGGTSLFATTSVESIQTYIDSAVRYQLIEARGADVLIANHTSSIAHLTSSPPSRTASQATRIPMSSAPTRCGAT